MAFRISRLALLLTLTAACAAPEELATRSLAFERHWNLFIRHLAGCPDSGETTKEACTLARFIDSREFAEARRAAMPLFQLEEKK